MQSDSISFRLAGYNDSYHEFFAEMFKEIKSFQPTKSFYDDKRLTVIRALKNSLLVEPYQLIGQHVSNVLDNNSCTV